MPPGCYSTSARHMVGRWMTAACAGPADCDAASARSPSLLPGWGSTCGVIRLMGSGAARRHHDSYGFHPSSCRSGNREGLWTQRHDVVEDMLMYVMRRLGQSPIRVSRGARNWFGAAAMRPDGSFRRADVVLRGYYGQGRHLFLDVAVADPAGQAPMQAAPSSCASSGVAAELRALRKVQRYAPLAAAVSSAFRPAVVERFGAFSDALVGVVREVCGDRDRDALLHDDVTFSQSSRTTWAAGLLALAVVVADAAMLDAAIGLDVRHEGGGDDGDGGAGARGWDGAGTPRHWEIEGRGGHFWYEQAGRR